MKLPNYNRKTYLEWNKKLEKYGDIPNSGAITRVAMNLTKTCELAKLELETTCGKDKEGVVNFYFKVIGAKRLT